MNAFKEACLAVICAITIASSAHATVTAFSYTGFSGTQGADGWYYGTTTSTNGRGGYNFLQFSEMNIFSGATWSQDSSGAFITNVGACPGRVGTSWYFPVRRWNVSTSGIVNISGNWQKPMTD